MSLTVMMTMSIVAIMEEDRKITISLTMSLLSPTHQLFANLTAMWVQSLVKKRKIANDGICIIIISS